FRSAVAAEAQHRAVQLLEREGQVRFLRIPHRVRQLGGVEAEPYRAARPGCARLEAERDGDRIADGLLERGELEGAGIRVVARKVRGLPRRGSGLLRGARGRGGSG